MHAKGNSRRTRVPGHRGVYYRDTANDGRVYEIGYLDSTGKQRWQVVHGMLEDAVAARAKIVVKKHEGHRVVRERLTFAEAAERWLAYKKTASNRKDKKRIKTVTLNLYTANLRVHVMPVLGRRKLTSINSDDLSELISYLLDDLAANTVHNVMIPVSGIFKYGLRKGLIGHDPFGLLLPEERPSRDGAELRVLTAEEITALVDAADDVHRPIIATGIGTGLRQSELLGMVWREIDFAENLIRVRRQLDRKTRERVATKTPESVREVRLEPSLARFLKEYKLASRHSDPGDYVFTGRGGIPLDHRNVSRRGLQPAVEAAGLTDGDQEKVSWHNLRHSFASIRIAEHPDATALAYEMGHTKASTTQDIYVKLFKRPGNGEREGLMDSILAAALYGKNVERGPVRDLSSRSDTGTV